jgi:hypothetical protein
MVWLLILCVVGHVYDLVQTRYLRGALKFATGGGVEWSIPRMRHFSTDGANCIDRRGRLRTRARTSDGAEGCAVW